SDPVVLPNGDLQVIFNNGNTQAGNPNGQQLGVHCRPAGKSTDGSAHLNCGSPSFVGADVTHGEPLCDFGRGPEECIPGPFIRTNDFPRISRNVIDAQAPLVHADPRVLYATWQDYKRGEFDIELSVSTDSGLSWRQTQYP